MTKQRTFDFFDDKPNNTAHPVIISKSAQVLTKQQKEFNKLVKKIETLRKELEQDTINLDNHLKYYLEHIRPEEQELIAARKNYLDMIIPFITEKKALSKKEKEALKEHAVTTLDEVLISLGEEPDDELKRMFELLNGRTFEEMQKEEFSEMKGDLEDLFKGMGFDVDLGQFNAKMSEEEIFAKAKELQDQFEKQSESMKDKQASKKKTQKQKEREALVKQKEEIKNKSIRSIYKQLINILHPDRESDLTQKMVKEEVMKQLTTAYEKNDLYTLLRLEIEWMEKQDENVSKLTDDKLSLFNQVLKEQVRELEEQAYMLSENPRYDFLYRIMDYEELVRNKTITHKKEEIQQVVHSLRSTIDDELNDSVKAIKFVKEVAKYMLEHQRHAKKMENYFANFFD